MRTKRSGATLMEMIVSLFMSLMIAGALFSVFTTTFQTRATVVGQGTAETNARSPIDELADHLRNAQQYWTTGATTPTSVAQSMVLAAGTATSVTYYKSNSSTDTVRYWLNGTNLQRTADGATTTVLANVQTLAFTYEKTVSGNYNVDYTNSLKLVQLGSLTAADLPYVSAVDIDAKVNVDGYSRELACRVRLRNSPFKVSL